MKRTNIEIRIRRAALLTFLGLAIQLPTLLVTHPLAFVAFVGLGCPLVFAGILLYLTSLVSAERIPGEEADQAKAVAAGGPTE